MALVALAAVVVLQREAASSSDDQICDSGWGLEAIPDFGAGVSPTPEEAVRAYVFPQATEPALSEMVIEVTDTGSRGRLALVRRRGVVKGSFTVANNGGGWRITRERSCSELYR